jgi:hypothetical protein
MKALHLPNTPKRVKIIKGKKSIIAALCLDT